MPRRRGRPGLVGTMARTAVVAGTATAVVGHSQQKQAAAANAQQQEADAQQAAYQAQADVADMQAQMAAMQAQPAPAAAPVADLTTQLQQIAALHAQGVLTDAEFAAAKAQLLG